MKRLSINSNVTQGELDALNNALIQNIKDDSLSTEDHITDYLSQLLSKVYGIDVHVSMDTSHGSTTSVSVHFPKTDTSAAVTYSSNKGTRSANPEFDLTDKAGLNDFLYAFNIAATAIARRHRLLDRGALECELNHEVDFVENLYDMERNHRNTLLTGIALSAILIAASWCCPLLPILVIGLPTSIGGIFGIVGMLCATSTAIYAFHATVSPEIIYNVAQVEYRHLMDKRNEHETFRNLLTTVSKDKWEELVVIPRITNMLPIAAS